jgi:photosystem II stability/assembly factor-like uncharacterized protein
MMNHLLLSVLIFSSLAFPQEFWQKITTLRTSNSSFIAINQDGYIFSAYSTPQIENGKVYRSTNEGASWSLVSESSWNRITDITINHNSTVFVGTNGTGLYRSTDNGTSWVKLNINSNFDNIQAIANGSNGIIYTGCGTVGGQSIGIFRSTDNGNQWSLILSLYQYNYVYSLFVNLNGTLIVSTQDSGIVRTTNNGITWDSVRVEPASSFVEIPSGEIFCTNVGGSEYGVSKSTDEGQTWNQVNTGLPDSATVCIASNLLGELYAGHSTGIYHSLNSGNTWNKISNNFSSYSVLNLSCYNNQKLFAGTQYDGVLRSIDNGINWELTDYPSDDNLPIKTIFTLKNGNIYVSVEAGFGYILYKSSDEGLSWHPAIDGLDAFNVNALSMDKISGNMYIGSDPHGFYLSSDEGTTWVVRNTGLTNTFIQTLSTKMNGDIFAGTYFGGVFRTTNEGMQWQEVNNGITYTNIVSLIVPSNETILAGGGAFPTGGNATFRSTNNGDNWHIVLDNPCLSFTQIPGGKVFALVKSDVLEIWVSTDEGENWTNPNQGPGIFAELLTSNSLGSLLAGNSSTVYISVDEGIYWHFLEHLPNNTIIRYLAVDSLNFLYVGSEMGLYKSKFPVISSLDEDSKIIPDEFMLYQNYPNPFNPKTRISYSIARSDLVQIKLFDIMGTEIKTLINEYLKAGTYEVEFEANDLTSGVYFYRMVSGNYSETKKLILLR